MSGVGQYYLNILFWYLRRNGFVNLAVSVLSLGALFIIICLIVGCTGQGWWSCSCKNRHSYWSCYLRCCRQQKTSVLIVWYKYRLIMVLCFIEKYVAKVVCFHILLCPNFVLSRIFIFSPGDTVNTSSRMQSTGVDRRIQVSEQAAAFLSMLNFD